VPDQPQGGIGGQAAQLRKLNGLTQAQLAQRAHVSLSLVRKVEQGSAPASPAFVSATARALGVGVAELLGQPIRPADAAEHQVFAVIPPLRRELAAYRLPPDDGSTARSLAELQAEVDRASRMRHLVDLTALGAALPGLLAELRAAVHTLTGAEQEWAFGLLAEMYYAAGQLASKLGYVDLASLSVDRYEWAAARSGDELAVLVGDYRRAGELISLADWAAAQRLLERSRARLEPGLGRADAPTLSTWGNLHLKSALAAARAGDQSTSDAHLAEARETAARIGADRDDYRLCFGPTNVAIWAVGLAVEAGDSTEAVKRAEGFVPPPTAPRERVGHHWIDLARGYLLHGDRHNALSSLMTARRTAPQQTRYHPMVAETVRTLARGDRRRSDSLSGFAAWMGVTA
jgi:transcriptional regulator with XRE-family HTH domain